MPPDTAFTTADIPSLTRAATLRGGMWAVFGAASRYVIVGVTTLALTRILEPEDFGLVAIAALVQLLIEHIVPIGFQDALIQRPRLTVALLDSAFWSIALVAAVAVVIVAGAAAPVSAWYGDARLAPLFIGMAFAALARAISTVPRALLHRRLDFRTLALVGITGLAVAGIGAIALAAVGAGAWSLVAHVAFVNAVTSLLIAQKTGYFPGRSLSQPALRELWRFAPSVALFFTLNTLIIRLDDQIIGFRLGAEALGHYALAYAIMAWPVRDVLGGAAVVLYPIFSRLQDDRERLQRVYLDSLTLTTLFAFPVLALLAIAAPVLIPWLLGAKWNPAVLPAQILALGGFRAAAGMLNGGIYRALNRPHLHTLLEFVSLPCYLTAFLVGVKYGIAGVALMIGLAGILLQPLSWLLLFAVSGLTLRRWLGALAPAAVGTLLLAFAAIPTLHYTTHARITTDLRLVLTGLSGASVYGLWVLYLRPTAVKWIFKELKRLW